ncbi:amidohydrolase [candidate division KSB1 bacterium]|nr:amidohydrolase [candidate division KSB1 bacterium]
MKQFNVLIAVFLLLSAGCSMQPADTIIINAKIYTGNSNKNFASAIAIHGDRILAVGPGLTIDKYRTNRTKIIDAQGRLLMPGFNDAHCHFASGGRSLRTLSFRGVDSIEKIQQMIADKLEESEQDEIIYGRNYDHTLFPDKKFPSRYDLDKVAPNNPVIINRVDGHSCWVNSLALKMSNITKKTKDPFGGTIVRDPKSGEPIGILKETAMDLLHVKDPYSSLSDHTINDIKLALQHAAKLGVTSIHTSSTLKELDIFKRLEKQHELTVRVYAWLPVNTLDTLVQRGIHTGDGDNMVRVGFLKCFIDGTLGSGTALFFEPYTDDPTTSGLAQYSESDFIDLIARAHKAGYQTGTHAIGSKGVHWVLNAIDSAQQIYGDKKLRHRIEHAQVIRDVDFPRFAQLGVIASMQPTHCTTDLRFCEQRIGKQRSRGAYAWRTLLNQGATIAFGTDWPVEPLDPMRGLYSAVTRINIETDEPKGGWFPEQRLTLDEAIHYYTVGSAYASFEENEKGQLVRGQLADLVMLDKDLFQIPVEEILTTGVVMTMVGGKIVYSELEK